MISINSTKKNKQNAAERVLEMRAKIADDAYLDSAIHRIALVLSRKLVENSMSTRK
jgi:hypothetical protein